MAYSPQILDNIVECQSDNHDLLDINTEWLPGEVTRVVRWCQVCGAIVIDRDYDNRTSAGYYMKMRGPQITTGKE
jgi:hypothetical protein